MEIFLEKRWKDIGGYEGLYKISDHGDVFSVNAKRILIGGHHAAGYRKVNFCKGKKVSSINIYLLVARAFIPNLENKKCVNHIDGNKKNDHYLNLEWVTYQENSIHAYKIGLMNHHIGHTGINNVLSKKVDQFSLDGEFIKRWDSQMDIKRMFGIDSSAVSKVARGINKTAGGFIWKFVI